jgi:integrase
VWRDGGRRAAPKRFTPIVPRKGDARRLLDLQLQQVRAGVSIDHGLTLAELAARFHAQHVAAPRTVEKLHNCLKRPLELWGHLHPDQLTPEHINRWLATSELRPSTRQTYLAALRQLLSFGVDNHLIADNAAKRARTPTVRRAESLLPFSSWDEVERVAEEAGKWASFIILAADTGARPGELIRLEHDHVFADRVYLPGTKTRNARRIVRLTPRGLAAYDGVPRSAATPLVFHRAGKPLDLHNWRCRTWYPALELAGLARRGPYALRHTFAYFSLLAGVPLADLSIEMGHESIRLTADTYGHWADDMGRRAADLRTTWAAGNGHRGATQRGCHGTPGALAAAV